MTQWAGNPRDRVGLFLLVDSVPEHVVQTFGLVHRDDDPLAWKSTLWGDRYVIYRMGDKIDDRQHQFVVVYNAGDYHNTEAVELQRQLEELCRARDEREWRSDGCQILSIPVRG